MDQQRELTKCLVTSITLTKIYKGQLEWCALSTNFRHVRLSKLETQIFTFGSQMILEFSTNGVSDTCDIHL